MCFADALAGICRAPISITIEIDPAMMMPPSPCSGGGSIVDRDHSYADDVLKSFSSSSAIGTTSYKEDAEDDKSDDDKSPFGKDDDNDDSKNE